jgi:SAM-dependent methyltransferase
MRPNIGDNVLDIGCGPAEIIGFLPSVDYWGFDISEKYIERARQNYPDRTHFFSRNFVREDLESIPKMDIAVAIGVLHHMDDAAARELFYLACSSLKSGGRFITLDPCFEDGQNPLARFFISRDRGQNVRTQVGYENLVPSGCRITRSVVRHKNWIPYTHCLLECRLS